MADPVPTFTDYKGFPILQPEPTGEGGQKLNAISRTAGDRLEGHDTAITDLSASIVSKAAQSTVDTLTTQLGAKASQTSVNTLAGNLTTLTTTVGTKANQAALDTTNTNVSNLTTVVANKATFADVDGVEDMVNTHAADQNAHGLAAVRGSIDGKAALNHVHTIGNVTGLQDALDAKATTASLSGYATTSALASGLAGKASSTHTHVIGDTTGLQAALDGKAATSHIHAIGNVTGLQTALNGKLALDSNNRLTVPELRFTGANFDGGITAIGSTLEVQCDTGGMTIEGEGGLTVNGLLAANSIITGGDINTNGHALLLYGSGNGLIYDSGYGGPILTGTNAVQMTIGSNGNALTLNEDGLNANCEIVASSFVGNGSGLTNLSYVPLVGGVVQSSLTVIGSTFFVGSFNYFNNLWCGSNFRLPEYYPSSHYSDEADGTLGITHTTDNENGDVIVSLGGQWWVLNKYLAPIVDTGDQDNGGGFEQGGQQQQ